MKYLIAIKGEVVNNIFEFCNEQDREDFIKEAKEIFTDFKYMTTEKEE